MMTQTEFLPLFRRFNRFYANLLARFAGDFYNAELTLNEANVLTEIQQTPDITAQQICQSLSMNKGQLSVVLKKFEVAGWLEKTPDEADKRSFKIRLTAQGEAAFVSQRARTDRLLVAELDGLPEAQIALLAEAAADFEQIYRRAPQLAVVEGGVRDIGFIADLHSKIYTDMGYRPEFQPYVLEALSAFVKNGVKGKIWLAMLGDKRIGTVSLIKHSEEEWQLRWFATDSRYQGLGAGKKLMDTLMAFVRQSGIQRVTLGTVSDLGAARELYRCHGFRLVSETVNMEWKAEAITEETWVWEADYSKPK
ncbi:helix-turn-helix domain-containing GNAT family N-acetyltransferase [Kingella kingae]|uniref:bifunctional helix-turn-helix transcriptional regulator/GNAT family N-acetyltransferase n=2 Tax=Kingella kingae TaxID=504 RepID=UPI00254C7C56|nr:helix-turn-helix domain-containing GNAT family N-acetyltransferase [Kingella kingae]MDK4545767.1 helix-turn-helix domain-containing GNAT family N-acetyltransferase [Kingella kingae]MDK4567676.1 helix-turn-helix domain-containing GNAT family N-acetyltransferase [Kingella kingae]MDK4587427.1 helix-turn-helix domain-containing GNAT family N-acetyltransferase [Kingella kingae]MDK4591372.1 helix-turn-helix domain-containing GNAT family N-acetyltransferase [Kingella kingae]MDK4605484.1 helix-turn